MLENLVTSTKSTYDVHLLNDIKSTKTYIFNTKASLWVSTSIAIEDDQTVATLFKIHPFPTVKNGVIATPSSKHNFIAVLALKKLRGGGIKTPPV